MDIGTQETNHPLTSKTIKVRGSDMHYLEQGEGNPILFLHGIPTSSHVWRNIMPPLSINARCIAPDLIGMGKSDKPDIDYRVFDHIDYIEDFIAALDLKNITLVLHGWGSVIGFDYASRHENNISGLAFFESHIRPTIDWEMLSLPVQQMASLLKRPGASYRAIVQQNYLVKKLLPKAIIRDVTSEEMEQYLQPFPTPESRKPLWQYIKDLPLGKGPDDIIELIARYSKWLEDTEIAKLMLYAIPGFMTTVATVQWARDNIKNLDLVGLDDVLHFAQESVPHLFAEKLREWYPKSISVN